MTLNERFNSLEGFRKREAIEMREKLVTETYQKNGALYWTGVDRPVPVHCFADACLPVPDGQETAVDAHNDAFIAEYKRRMANHVPSEEELFEMRAAFGENTVVVNAITGRRTRL